MVAFLKNIGIAVVAIFLGFTVLIMLLIAGPIGLALSLALAIGLPIWGFSRWKTIRQKQKYTKHAGRSDDEIIRDAGLPREIYRDIKSGTEYLATLVQKRMAMVWGELEVEFANLSLIVQHRLEMEKGKWFKRRIEEFIAENANTFDFISQRMVDDDLNRIRIEYMDVCERINAIEKKVADIKANIAMKGELEEGPFHRLLERTKVQLDSEESNRDWCVEQTKKRMSAYGVELNNEQAQVLLSRIDADDIIRMTTVFAVIAKMTEQLAATMRASGENLDVTKKYYGIYLVLLELQVYVQDIYLARLENEYLPGVKKINHDANELLNETRRKLKGSEDKQRPYFEKNIQSLEFSIRVTHIYEVALQSDTRRITKARKLISKQHEAAENTLKTVQVSAVLSDLVRQNEALYHEVMTLQAPELIPFENLQIQREFEAVTSRIKNSSS